MPDPVSDDRSAPPTGSVAFEIRPGQEVARIVQVMARAGRAEEVGAVLAGLSDAGHGTVRASRTAPDAWLVIGPPDRPFDLRDILAGRAHVTDLSHAHGVATLSGPDAGAVIMKASGLDLAGIEAATGVRTRMEGFAVFLECRAPFTDYRLFVAASMMESFRHWLIEATAEFR